MFLRENEEGGKIAPWVERGQRVLDVGGGTGFISRWLRDRTGVAPTMTDVVEYRNRDRSIPFLRLHDPFRLPVADASFDVVLMMFVMHHIERAEDQVRLLSEAVRVARSRLIVLEDTPGNAVDRVMNTAWDWLLNQRHRVPTPFTFRDVDGWLRQFKEMDLSIVHVETYRPMWPTLKTYPHSIFVLDR